MTRREHIAKYKIQTANFINVINEPEPKSINKSYVRSPPACASLRMEITITPPEHI